MPENKYDAMRKDFRRGHESTGQGYVSSRRTCPGRGQCPNYPPEGRRFCAECEPSAARKGRTLTCPVSRARVTTPLTESERAQIHKSVRWR